MKTSRLRLGFSIFTVAFSGLALVGSGCGGDDSNGAASGDSGASDGTTAADGTRGDGSLGGDGSKTDSGGSDAGDAALPPPHVVFVTSVSFTGDLVAEAFAVEADAGVDAGALADAGDGGSAYLVASDILCTHVARAAGLTGSYAAILSAGSDDPLDRFSSSDGPWARVDGTPVADSIGDLRVGNWRSTIDVTEKGDVLPYNSSFVWGHGATSADCSGWQSTSGTGRSGSFSYTSFYALFDTASACTSAQPLYCAEVGPGAGPNRYPVIPAGGKLAFVVDEALPGNFALPDAGVLDASAPDAGDELHSVGDAICTEFARGEGKTGTYHAWVSSSSTDAKTFFMNHSMNGPWYRADGLEIAASLTELTTTGARTQLETLANGKIAPNVGSTVLTGTLGGGTVSANCADFTSIDPAVFARQGRTAYKTTDFTAGNVFDCQNPGGIYCFEE